MKLIAPSYELFINRKALVAAALDLAKHGQEKADQKNNIRMRQMSVMLEHVTNAYIYWDIVYPHSRRDKSQMLIDMVSSTYGLLYTLVSGKDRTNQTNVHLLRT